MTGITSEELSSKLQAMKYSLQGEINKKYGEPSNVSVQNIPSPKYDYQIKVFIQTNYSQEIYVIWKPKSSEYHSTEFYWERES